MLKDSFDWYRLSVVGIRLSGITSGDPIRAGKIRQLCSDVVFFFRGNSKDAMYQYVSIIIVPFRTTEHLFRITWGTTTTYYVLCYMYNLLDLLLGNWCCLRASFRKASSKLSTSNLRRISSGESSAKSCPSRSIPIWKKLQSHFLAVEAVGKLISWRISLGCSY